MEKFLHKVTYAKESNMEDTCWLIMPMSVDDQPDARITLQGERYVRVATYMMYEQAHSFHEGTRADVEQYLRGNQGLVPSKMYMCNVLEPNIPLTTTERSAPHDEARAISPTLRREQETFNVQEKWDSDCDVQSICSVESASAKKPITYTRTFHVNFTGDPEVDLYWEQERARREKEYKLGLHRHIQNLHYSAHTKRQCEELIQVGVDFNQRLHELRDKTTPVWQEEDLRRAQALDDDIRGPRIRQLYERHMRERALKLRQRRQEYSKQKERNKVEAELTRKGIKTLPQPPSLEDRIEAALRRFQLERGQLCTRERLMAEIEKLKQTVEYRFYTILITNDWELLPKVDREMNKNPARLLHDKQHIVNRMIREESMRLKNLAAGTIVALNIDEYLTLKRMQGVNTSEWTYEIALAKYEQYNVHLGLIIGEEDIREGSFRTTRWEFAEELFVKYKM